MMELLRPPRLKQRFETTRITQQSGQGSRSVRLQRLHDHFVPPEPFFYVALLASAQPRSVSAGGQQLPPPVGSRQELKGSAVDAWFWDGATQTTFIKVFDGSPDMTITAAS